MKNPLRTLVDAPAQVMRVRTALVSDVLALQGGTVMEFVGDIPAELRHALEPFEGERPPNCPVFDTPTYVARKARLAAIASAAPPPLLTLDQVRERFKWTPEQLEAARRYGFPGPARQRLDVSGSTPQTIASWNPAEVDAWYRELVALVR